MSPYELRDAVTYIRNHRTETSAFGVVANSGADGSLEDSEGLSVRDSRRYLVDVGPT